LRVIDYRKITSLDALDAADPSSPQPDQGFSDEDIGLVGEALGHLNPRERQVVEMHYGLNGYASEKRKKFGHAYTLEEIGQVISPKKHLTRERVRQIKECALGKLAGVLGPKLGYD